MIPASAQAKSSLLPWPNDSLTKRDRKHRHRSPAQPARGRDAAQQGRRADRPDRHEPRRRLQPRLDDDREGPGARHAGGARSAASCRRSATCARSLSPRSPVVVFNARTGKRHPVWAELDSNATTDANRMLMIRPAKNFTEGQRYVVVLRNLKDANGKTIKSRAQRQARVRSSELRRAGIKRRGHIYRVWSFTVASERSLAGRAAAHPRRRLQGARRLQPARPEGRRAGAAVHDHHRHRT